MHVKQIPSVIRSIGVRIVIGARENAEDDVPHPWDAAIDSSGAALKHLKCDLAFKINSSIFVERLSLVKILYMLCQASHDGCDSCFIHEAWK